MKLAYLAVFLLIGNAVANLPDNFCAVGAFSNVYVNLKGKTYLISGTINLSWFEAERFCQGWHLFWIDGNDLGSEGKFYSRLTYDRMAFEKWSPTNPSNTDGNENCVLLIKVEDPENEHFAMNDENCNSKRGFICQI